jgi:A/G-specific adenine glycosylase
VYRVLARVFGIETPIDSGQGKKEFYQLANELIDKKNPAMHNQAIMELGAIQCKPVNPDCSVCPLNTMCFAYSNKRISELPVKAKKLKTRDRFFNYIVLNHDENIAIKKRLEKDIWINLYDFPLIETEKELTEEQFLRSAEWLTFIGKNKYTLKYVSMHYKHILSHQKIYARFWEIHCSKPFNKIIPKTTVVIQKKDIHTYPVSRLIEKYLQDRNY